MSTVNPHFSCYTPKPLLISSWSENLADKGGYAHPMVVATDRFLWLLCDSDPTEWLLDAAALMSTHIMVVKRQHNAWRLVGLGERKGTQLEAVTQFLDLTQAYDCDMSVHPDRLRSERFSAVSTALTSLLLPGSRPPADSGHPRFRTLRAHRLFTLLELLSGDAKGVLFDGSLHPSLGQVPVLSRTATFGPELHPHFHRVQGGAL